MESGRNPIPAWLVYVAVVAAMLAAMLFFSSTDFVVEQGRILSSEGTLSTTAP